MRWRSEVDPPLEPGFLFPVSSEDTNTNTFTTALPHIHLIWPELLSRD